jgi:hypothetical protein
VTSLWISTLTRRKTFRSRYRGVVCRCNETGDNQFVDEDFGFRVFKEGVAKMFEDFLGFFVGVIATIVRLYVKY